MNDKLLRAAIYIRVSTAEQQIHGKSLQAQREFLENYAKEHNMVIAGIYADEGKTARKELKKRKAIHSLIEAVKHREIDIIVFWKMDRWFRNVSDFYKIQDILDEYKVKWIAVAEPNINMDTRDGRLNLNIMLSIGQNEVDTTSERIKFTNESIIKNGKLIFGDKNMPYGYKSGYVNGEKRMVKDDELSPIVEECFRYFMLHQNKRKTVSYIQENFDPEFTYAILNRMMKSEFYIGKYRSNENYCPAYLTKDMWDKIQEFRIRNIRTNSTNRIYLFTGLLLCPVCGLRLSGNGRTITLPSQKTKTYNYYRCNRASQDRSCSFNHRVNQETLENYLLENLQHEYDSYKMRCAQAAQELKKMERKINPDKIKKEMNNLNIMFQKERINWEYYDKEYKRLEKDLLEVKKIIPEKIKNTKHIDDILNDNFIKLYKSLDAYNKRAFWRSFIEKIMIDEKSNVIKIDFF